jgi:DNA adenine methylase|tara:strand:+ start:201 stop:1022 length:822 start_codon:yes stop_codon:yes gene_type:complete
MALAKTPLRYPGGKSRAATKIYYHMPRLSEYSEYREPFLGGGSMAIYISQMYPTLPVVCSDLYEPLVNFWIHLRDDGEQMAEDLLKIKREHNTPDAARELFIESKRLINEESTSNKDRSRYFWVSNKCSFSGLTESSSFSKQASISNFSERNIMRLPTISKVIRNWKILHQSYDKLLQGDDKAFVYLDPPYDIKDNLYGKQGNMHKGFDHDQFAIDCQQSSNDCIISYNADQFVSDRFPDWRAADFDLTYTMRSVGEYMKNQTKRKELLLMNY